MRTATVCRRLVLAMAPIVASLASADEVRIVFWNADAMFSPTAVNRRAGDLQLFARHYPQVDIVILDEVTSLDVVNTIRDRMGLAGYHTTCSDFAQDDHDTYNSLEVGIISRFPLANTVEFDPSTDNTGAVGEPAEKPLKHAGLPSSNTITTSRGFLTTKIPALGLTVVATHLKSSRGQAGKADHDNAQKRELVAAAMARFAAEALKTDSSATVLVAGDMNVGETDVTKNGFRLEDDYFARDQGDLYDDTHAIFSAGLVQGLHMASLTKSLGTETYDDTKFAGAGPIDCLYVAGAQASDFLLAKRSGQTFGSDHFAVSTRFLFTGTAPRGRIGKPTGPLAEAATPSTRSTPATPVTSSVRISSLLPNPVGLDQGNEWVKLKNDGKRIVDVTGWQLRDRAGNAVILKGVIASGAELKISLTNGQMPLNNNADEIELRNVQGQLFDKVRYSGQQAAAGNEVQFRK